MGRDDRRVFWASPEQLGTVQELRHRGKRLKFELPKEFVEKTTLRFRGQGRSDADGTRGDLLLVLRSTAGQAIHRTAWLSREEASSGALLQVGQGKRRYTVRVPPGCSDGQLLRLRGAGERPGLFSGAPLFRRQRGDVFVTLRTYEPELNLRIATLDQMSASDLALEAFIYRRIDELQETASVLDWPLGPLELGALVRGYNQRGWEGIYDLLLELLPLPTRELEPPQCLELQIPGRCRTRVETRTSKGRLIEQRLRHQIELSQDYTDDPFSTGAILAHELCHVLYRSLCQSMNELAERMRSEEQRPGAEREALTLYEERSVDLLVCLMGLGELQIRAQRSSQVCFGYYPQRDFERMYRNVLRKRAEWGKTGG